MFLQDNLEVLSFPLHFKDIIYFKENHFKESKNDGIVKSQEDLFCLLFKELPSSPRLK